MSQMEGVERINGDFNGKDVISIGQFERPDVEVVMTEAAAMADVVATEGRIDLLADKLVANLFYEPSTRTFLSFEAAAKRLGADTLETQGVEYSSISKGETLADTIRTVERYADVIDMRHPDVGAAAVAAAAASKPVINGGDGIGEHPTQALLDLFTIKAKASDIPENLTVTMVGDLKHGRTVHSLARLLALYGSRLNYVSPDELAMPAELCEELAQSGVEQFHTDQIADVLPESDVLYVTRVQKERFADQEMYEALKHGYIITPDTLAVAKPDLIVMHPLPRVGEIVPAVDADPRAVYFDQVENGMYVRMALLALVCGRTVVSHAQAEKSQPTETVTLQ